MDLKNIPKSRMEEYDYERKQRREREKSERQQIQTTTTHEVALFSEPRRLNPSEDDDDIAAKLGDYSKVKDLINRQMLTNTVLTGIVPPSASVIGGSGVCPSLLPSSSACMAASSQRLLPPPPPNLQQLSHSYQQQGRQSSNTYVKHADNKPPYNGRGGYPGQPVNRSSSGMAPPKGPPLPSGALLPPPSTNHMPNIRHNVSSLQNGKTYLGPPTMFSSPMHNGRFSQPITPKNRQKHLPPENDIKQILNLVTDQFCPPKMLTGIDATPHNTLIENYNLSEPNKHKYCFDVSRSANVIESLDSPQRSEMSAPNFVPQFNSNSSQLPSHSTCISHAISPIYVTPTNSMSMLTSTSAAQQPSINNNCSKESSPSVPISPLLTRKVKESFTKNFKSGKPTPPPTELGEVEKQNTSTLENDLELSESDDDHKKQGCSTVNSSDSTQSESSESGSEESIKSDAQHSKSSLLPPQLLVQQQPVGNAVATKKKFSLGSNGFTTINGNNSNSSGLGSSLGSNSTTPCSSSSSSNKTPSPSNTTKWQLSRYFNKVPLHQTATQEVNTSSTVVNPVNNVNLVSLNMPTMLPGGAQIIPEPLQHVADVKSEDLINGVHPDTYVENDNGNRMNSTSCKNRSHAFPQTNLSGSSGFPSRKTPIGLSVTPLPSLLSNIKKETSDIHQATISASQDPAINSIPSSQIKHESISIAGGYTTVTTYSGDISSIKAIQKNAEDYTGIEGLSGLSSDSGGNDEMDRNRLPIPGPGGTLQIPGVPAAITALPRSPRILQKSQLPNTLTVTPVDDLSEISSQATNKSGQRAKKPRKKLKSQKSKEDDNSTDEEQLEDKTQSSALINLTAENSNILPIAKKGRGRPRKITALPTQNSNFTSASSASVKGPILTAKKDITKKPAKQPITAKRKNSRTSSTNSISQKNITPNQFSTLFAPPSQSSTVISPRSLHKCTSSDDSSSSLDSSAYSNSNSKSRSPSESDNQQPKRPSSSWLSSSGEDEKQKQAPFTNFETTADENKRFHTAPRRIVKQLITHRPSVEDAVKPLASNKIKNFSVLSSSSSSSLSSDSSVEEELNPTPAMVTSYTPHGSSSASHQKSPFKSISAAPHTLFSSRKPTSCSSPFSSESSDEHSGNTHIKLKKDKKLRKDKPKSDKNKINTLTRIFKTSNEGGAKKQGQVVIIDQSEEQLQQQQQKHNAAMTLSSKSSQELVFCHSATTGQSPRLTPSNSRSPGQFPPSSNQIGAQYAQLSYLPFQRVSDNNTPNTEHKQRSRPSNKKSSNALIPIPCDNNMNSLSTSPPVSLICKIDLTRLLRIPREVQSKINDRLRIMQEVNGNNTSSANDLLHYRDSLDEVMCNKQRYLDQSKNSERCRSHSVESNNGNGISGDNSGSKNKQPLPSIPNGCTVSSVVVTQKNSVDPHMSSKNGGVKMMPLGVKHESIKHDPDAEVLETKYKPLAEANLIKQEFFGSLKQDIKSSEATIGLTERKHQALHNDCSVQFDSKLSHKRSSISNSSPYKEKKRKKCSEKNKLTIVSPTKEKDVAESAALKIEKDPNSTSYNSNGVFQNEQQQMKHQLPPTNHDRLESLKLKAIAENVMMYNSGKTNSPAYLQNLNAANKTDAASNAPKGMPPPNNIGLIPPSFATGQSHTNPYSAGMCCNANSSIITNAKSKKFMTDPTSNKTLGDDHTLDDNNAVEAKPVIQHVIYRSYFERDDDALNDEFSKDTKFLQEAVHRKHAADREQNTFNQVTLYLEAVVYFLLSGAAMEQHSRSEEAAWTMYKDTLALIKYISTKFRHLQNSSSNQHETHNKVAILSLRCQSLISLKLYKLKRSFCRQLNTVCSDFFKTGKPDIVNGNTPLATSPSNSVCSQGSGSNTPPGKIVPQDIHSALQQQNQFFNYLACSHELWDQADRLVRQGNHTDFFIALDHENGPLTLHSSVYEVFRYVQAGIKKLKDEMLIQ